MNIFNIIDAMKSVFKKEDITELPPCPIDSSVLCRDQDKCSNCPAEVPNTINSTPYHGE